MTVTIDKRDFTTLKSGDKYGEYFELLLRACRMLISCYPKENSKDSFESQAVSFHLSKLLETIQVLRLKYTYCKETDRPLWVDTTRSGFPNAEELNILRSDFLNKEQKLDSLPSSASLKRELVDQLLKKQEDSLSILASLSERTYLSMDENKILFRFNPGELILLGEKGGCREYSYHWSCYDQGTNRPYIHVLNFTQDASELPLEEGNILYAQFIDALQQEGSRAPDVGILAMRLDEMIDWMHPKILKRLCVGPLYAPVLMEEGTETDDIHEIMLRQQFKECDCSVNDFALIVTDEMVFSKRQESESKGIFGQKVREIFWIPTTDIEAYARRASLVHHTLLLPHIVSQHLGSVEMKMFNQPVIFAYDEEGEVYGK